MSYRGGNLEFETMPCKICAKPTRMLGTKLCDWCYHGVRDGGSMMDGLGVDMEIKLYRNHSEFRWSVDLLTDDVTYGHCASSFEEALAGAMKSMREAI